MRKYIIFFGPPGSGKGTQADMLAEKLKIPVICPGELLRAERDEGTKLGKRAAKKMSQGKMISNKIVEEIIDKRFEKPDVKKGVIFDGYPRVKAQLKLLLKRLIRQRRTSHGLEKSDKIIAILVDVSAEEVKNRLGGRRVCDCGAAYHLKFNPPKKSRVCDLCGERLYIRKDDTPKVIKNRLKLYKKKTNPVIDYFKKNGKLIVINGEQDIKKVQRDIIKNLK